MENGIDKMGRGVGQNKKTGIPGNKDSFSFPVFPVIAEEGKFTLRHGSTRITNEFDR